MKITLRNDNHNTSINLIVKDGKLTEAQVKRAKSALCCSDCCCSDDFGRRGDQDNELEPIADRLSGKIVGAYVYADGEYVG